MRRAAFGDDPTSIQHLGGEFRAISAMSSSRRHPPILQRVSMPRLSSFSKRSLLIRYEESTSATDVSFP